MKLDTIVTNIVAQVEADLAAGVATSWKRGWSLTNLPRAYSGREYHGMNILTLWGGETGCWITEEQAIKQGGAINPDTDPHWAVLWKFLRKRNVLTDKVESFPLVRVYEVYDLSETTDVPAPPWLRKKRAEADKPPIEIDAEVQATIDCYLSRAKGLTLDHEGGSRAYYVPSQHQIHIPRKDDFFTMEEYCDTIFHELGHSTGHKSLLDRFNKQEFGIFGNTSYSKEELVAELCSAMVCATLGVNTEDTKLNASAYVRGWMKKIKEDPRLLVSAASKGERAARMILDAEQKLLASLAQESYTTRKGKEMEVVALRFSGGIPDDNMRSDMKRVTIEAAGKKMFFCPSDKVWRVAFTAEVMARLTTFFKEKEVLEEEAA